MTEQYPQIENREDMVIIRGGLGRNIIFDIGYPGDGEGWDEVAELFDIDDEDYISNPGDMFYQGIGFMRLITRKSDGKVFGHGFWASPGHDNMESMEDDQAELAGVHYNYEEGVEAPYVFLPVKAFQRTGYEVVFPHEN